MRAINNKKVLQNIIMFNNNKDFDFDLARGVKSEHSLAQILGLSKDKFEVKSEFGFWQKSGNICIELAYKGKPSGLRTTKAKYWVHRFMFNKDVCVGQWLVPVKNLKQIVKIFIKENKKRKSQIIRMLGDNYQSRCVLIPMSEFLNLWRKVEIKTKDTKTK
jgi:hypothetical protein